MMTASAWCERVKLPCALFLGLMIAATAVPSRADSIDDDFAFASGLVKWRFPDYAQKVVDQILRLHPDQADRANLVKAEVLIAARKFTEAEDLIKSMPAGNQKAEAIRLALAVAYFSSGDTEKAKQIYNDFFTRFKQVPTDPDLLRFYRDAAYQFGAILEQAGDLAGAADAYGKILATNPERDIGRRIMADQSLLYVRLARSASGPQREEYLKKAQKLCEDIQWGGVDLMFGESIITLANIELVRGDKAKAQKTIKDYMEMLKEIDGMLKEHNQPLSMSPMAGARFLSGEIYQQEADAIVKDPSKRDAAISLYAQALTEYYNVFVRYGDSTWGPEAGVRANAVKTALESLGRKVNIDLGAQQDQAAQTQFRLGDNLYRQKKFAEAIAQYLKTLNQFPQSGPSIKALTQLVLSYAELDDKLMVRAVAEYIGERFGGNNDAATALLALGKFYFDRKDATMYTFAYETYLRHFPQHDRAGAILFTLAGLRKQAGDTAGASALYERIVKNYPKDQYYPRALSQMAWSYYQAEDFAKAVEAFQIFVRDTQPSPDQALAQFSLADSFVRLGKYAEAIAEFEKLISWLAPKGNAYSTTPEGAEKNKQLLEKAVFLRAHTYGRMKEPPESIPTYRDRGLKGYDQFLSLFPNSDLAPKALRGKGVIQLDMGLKEAAAATFDELAAKYPQSEEGRNALYSLASSALEIGQIEQAKDAFNKMMQRASTFSPDEFVRLGQLMLDNKLYEQAIQAFRQVESSTDQRALLERALFGIGRASFELKKYEDAAKSLEQLMTRYPKSGLFYESKFLLGQAYAELGRLNDASLALGDVFRYAEDPVLINRASLTLGEIQKKQGDKSGALASFQRIALLADPAKPDLRPMIEQAIRESITLSMELERYQDVQESCDQYLQLFPTSDKVGQIRALKGEANLKAATK